MKTKLAVIILSALMAISFAACGDGFEPGGKQDPPTGEAGQWDSAKFDESRWGE